MGSRFFSALRWLRAWRAGRHFERQARGAVARIFEIAELRQGTSLKPEHASRAVLVRHEVSDGRLVRAWFGILRHPRPYAFSRQSHKVIEYYCYDLEAGTVIRQSGINLTRSEGMDAG